MKKRIGITPGAFSNLFVSICHNLKVEPVILDKETYISDLDLIIFPGGADINPQIYNQPNRASIINTNSMSRDIFEIKVLETAKSLSKKILAVCRGHQLVNAALGGSLIQEISWIKDHDNYHFLSFVKGTVGKFFQQVNSMHHQGVLSPGIGQEITSMYGGVIESTESENIITVQWHPECMKDKQSYDFFEYLFYKWN